MRPEKDPGGFRLNHGSVIINQINTKKQYTLKPDMKVKQMDLTYPSSTIYIKDAFPVGMLKSTAGFPSWYV